MLDCSNIKQWNIGHKCNHHQEISRSIWNNIFLETYGEDKLDRNENKWKDIRNCWRKSYLNEYN